jgi:2-polyprenylphenol 6-hydroxylase
MSEFIDSCFDADVMVVGGGVIGLASAIAMRLRDCSVTLLDAGDLDVSAVSHNTRVYAINHASQKLLTQLGVWETIAIDVRTPYQGMYIWDAKNKAKITFEARDIAAAEMGFMLEESVLRTALLKRADSLGVALIGDARVVGCTEKKVGMQLITDDERARHAKLCMIADGARSKTRDLLKVPMNTWSYHHDALVATVRTEKPHQAIAYQVFCSDGPLAFLPLKDPHQCSIVWSHPPEQIKALMTLEDSAFNAALTQAFSNKLGRVEVMTPRVSFPLHMRHVTEYRGASWVLLGDAAHTIHPLAGLGLNVGLADLQAWLNLLAQQKNKIGSVRMLDAYQRERKSEVWGVIMLMQAIKAMFGTAAAPIEFARGIGMRMLNQVGPLKRMLMTYAAGVDKE